MEEYFEGLWWSRLLVQRGLGAIYFLAFLTALNQFPALLGERGLLPVRRFLSHVSFREAPSIFHVRYSDRMLKSIAWIGMGLSVLVVTGLADGGPFFLSLAIWLVLWALYLSIVNVGQTFYAFGWESMLVEAGFFAAFLGPSGRAPSFVPMLILRWMLFRTELGAGLIKIRSDECWRNLTALFYHHETQPLPNPMSWEFHKFPKWMLKLGVLFSHFVQLVVPFGLFFPQPVALIAGGFIVVHQLWLIVSGNYAWLNWLTIVLGLTTISDSWMTQTFSLMTPQTLDRGIAQDALTYGIGAVTLLLSAEPAKNLLSKNQKMNYNFNALHLVNAYGAFGTVTRERYEIVVEGTSEDPITDATKWQAYEFKGKPGAAGRRPPQVAPYHLRLDWLMWFLPFSVLVVGDRILGKNVEPWFLRFAEKLLEGDRAIDSLLKSHPFRGSPPRYVRARFYRYELTSRDEHRKTGDWWRRKLVGEYMPPLELADFSTLDRVRRRTRRHA